MRIRPPLPVLAAAVLLLGITAPPPAFAGRRAPRPAAGRPSPSAAGPARAAADAKMPAGPAPAEAEGIAGGEKGREEAHPVVAEIAFHVDSPYPVSYEELASLITIRPGDPLTPEAVRESIRRLFAKSFFKEVSAYVREEGGGVRLLFDLRPMAVVAEIEVAGASRLPTSQIQAASRIRRGVPLEARDLRESERLVEEFLHRKGFAAARVGVSAVCNVESGAGKIRIQVEEGEPAVVRTLELPGASFFPPERLADMLGTRSGRPFDFRTWEEGVNGLRKAYKKAGFLTVRIHEPEVDCDEEEGFCVSARVEEGPRYDVRWEGAGGFSPAVLEEASGIYGSEETTEGAMVHDIRERLLAFYKSKDRFRAEVSVETGEETEGTRPLRIAVQEGPAGYLKEIRFDGNRSFPPGELEKQMTSREKGAFSFFTGSGKLGEEELSADLAALVGLYQKEGFVRARIAAVDNVWDEKGGVTVTIRIDEGPRYRLREIRIRGNDHFLRPELLKLMGNREGHWVDYVGLERDQEAIAAHYRDAGYLDASVEGSLRLDEGGNAAAALFTVVEGVQYRLGHVTVRGNQLADPVVVMREVPVREGNPVGEKDLLLFQQSVFGTGLYKSVRVQRLKRPAEGILDLIVEVEETLFFEVEFGGGYGTDTGVRGFVGVSDRNLNGRGRTLSGQIYVSEKEQRYVGSLREPWIFGNRWKWEGGVTGAYQETTKESFSLRKASLLTSVGRTVFERSSVSFQYELSREDTFDVAPGAVLSPEDQGEANIAALRALFVLDLRDDPFNPRRGSFNSGAVEFASRFLGSQVEYWKVTGQSSWYFPVARRNTFVVSARAGWAEPLDDTVEVPIQKRFFLGGRTTVRGFKEESLGPKGPDGSPVGGNLMVDANAEFRVPLRYGFLVAAFADAGSVWLRDDPANGFDLRESAGLGLRYVTPIGPLSFDYGWKLDRREGESPSEWHFTIGAVF